MNNIIETSKSEKVRLVLVNPKSAGPRQQIQFLTKLDFKYFSANTLYMTASQRNNRIVIALEKFVLAWP